MSALRIAIRGRETRFIDQGPAHASKKHAMLDARLASNIGAMVPVIRSVPGERLHLQTPSEARQERERTEARKR